MTDKEITSKTAYTWTAAEILAATGGQWLCGDKRRRFSGIGIDSRHLSEKELFIAIRGHRQDGHDYWQQVIDQKGSGLVVQRERGREMAAHLEKSGLACVAVEDTVVALGDLARFQRRRADIPVVAITGTNGKTTTKELTALVAGQRFKVLATAGNYNNAIGLPLTLLRLQPSHELVILEIGMNAPGEIYYLGKICEPDLGVILNVGSGHLAGVGSLQGVAQAKGELLETLGSAGVAFLNADDARVMALAPKSRAAVRTFGTGPKAQVWGRKLLETGAGIRFEISFPGSPENILVKLPGYGEYMIANVLAAAAVGQHLGLSPRQIKAGLESFDPAPGRMNMIETGQGIFVIDDSYNANPGSMEAAIAGLCAAKGEGRAIMVIGDMFELGEYAEAMHEEVGALAARSGVSLIYAVGEFAPAIKRGAEREQMATENIVIGSKADIVAHLMQSAGPGDWVLVKGSRGMNMETVVADLKAAISDKSENPGGGC